MKCSICNEKIQPDIIGWDKGHNAEPVNKGRCCTMCNDVVVLPARIALVTSMGHGDTLKSLTNKTDVIHEAEEHDEYSQTHTAHRDDKEVEDD